MHGKQLLNGGLVCVVSERWITGMYSLCSKKGTAWCKVFFMFVLDLFWQMDVQLGRMGVKAEGTTI